MFSLIYTSATATLIAIVLIIALRPAAVRLGLVDKPDIRKQHKGEVPLLGGPVIALVVSIGVFLSPHSTPWGLIAVGWLLVLLGMVDDQRPIPARVKLLLQFFAAALAVSIDQLTLTDIGLLQSAFNTPALHWLHVLLAVFAITIAINAFNFIDGIDGLSAGMALLALTHAELIFTLADTDGPPQFTFSVVLMSGALAGFLLFNLQVFNGRKIFLGDSGSMFIGLFIAVSLLNGSQPGQISGGTAIPAALCLWLIAIPLTDMTTIILRRILSGRSPMAPDRTHLHHIIIQAGFSTRRTLLVMILSAIGAFWLGYGIYLQWGEAASIIGFLIFIPAYYIAVQRAGVLVRTLS